MTTRSYLRPPVEDMVFNLYGCPIHPELFDILASRRINCRRFTLDLWITTAGHVISWSDRRARLTEVALAGQHLPGWGHLIKHRLRGVRCDTLRTLPGLNYHVSFQVETLAHDQFASVHHEILAAGGRRGLLHSFAANHRWAFAPVSAIDIDSSEHSLSLTAFHTFPDEATVVKTQSLIERK